ncbi:hypothetical protein J2754_000625 [Halarchaeum solikamskense]|nr:hypothetical protein [Halarchaeum solikamskense]
MSRTRPLTRSGVRVVLSGVVVGLLVTGVAYASPSE